MTIIKNANDEAICEAATYLREGRVVAFPTETVYGLGADAFNPEAIETIFVAKGRPRDNPLIVHVQDLDEIDELVTAWPQGAKQVAEAFWPGPLTLIFPASPKVPREITAGLSTVAIRMPSHPVARKLLKEAGIPVAAPSANRSGRPSPTKASHVWEDMEGRIPYILDGGETDVGLESTVLDMTVWPPLILRPGAVTAEMLEKRGVPVAMDPGLQPGEVPKSPGQKYRHYAPKAPVAVAMSLEEAQTLLATHPDGALLASRKWIQELSPAKCYPLSEHSDVKTSAAHLFDGLRTLDREDVSLIVVQGFVKEEMGVAYMNRLLKAAGREGKKQ